MNNKKLIKVDESNWEGLYSVRVKAHKRSINVVVTALLELSKKHNQEFMDIISKLDLDRSNKETDLDSETDNHNI